MLRVKRSGMKPVLRLRTDLGHEIAFPVKRVTAVAVAIKADFKQCFSAFFAQFFDTAALHHAEQKRSLIGCTFF